MNTLTEIKNFIFIDQFIFASNLTKILHDRFNFQSITSIPCREPFKLEKNEVFLKNYRTKGEEGVDDNVMKIVIHDLLESIQMIDKEVKPYAEYVFGVLGPNQYIFFQSVLPENKIVDVTQYKTIPLNKGEKYQSIKNIYHLVCQNWKDAFFHTARISTFVDVVRDLCTYNLPYRLKDLMVIPIPSTKFFTESKFLSENPKYSENENPNFHVLEAIFSLKYFIHAMHLPTVENITNGNEDDGKEIKIFITKLYHWNENNVNHLILEGLNAVKFLIFFAENIARQTPIGPKPVFAVLGKEQMSFFAEIFRECKYTNDNLFRLVKIMDISQYIPDEMDYVCRDRRTYLDYEYHARRVNIIQNYFKEHFSFWQNQ